MKLKKQFKNYEEIFKNSIYFWSFGVFVQYVRIIYTEKNRIY